jgi:hypothetical protein
VKLYYSMKVEVPMPQTSAPTPTQYENDQAALRMGIIIHAYDGSALQPTPQNPAPTVATPVTFP